MSEILESVYSFLVTVRDSDCEYADKAGKLAAALSCFMEPQADAEFRAAVLESIREMERAKR